MMLKRQTTLISRSPYYVNIDFIYHTLVLSFYQVNFNKGERLCHFKKHQVNKGEAAVQRREEGKKGES